MYSVWNDRNLVLSILKKVIFNKLLIIVTTVNMK